MFYQAVNLAYRLCTIAGLAANAQSQPETIQPDTTLPPAAPTTLPDAAAPAITGADAVASPQQVITPQPASSTTFPTLIVPSSSWSWDQWTAVISTPFVCIIGIALTAITMPGNWLIVLWAIILKVWQPDMVSWWSLFALVALAGVGEGLEFLASALGATKAGGSKHSAIGAMIGSLVGAIAGIVVPPPIIGSIFCAALGAAGGAVVGERYIHKKTWEHTGKVAAGAAIGRVIAMFAKILIAAIMSLILCLAVVIS